MREKRKINGKPILDDVRSGMTDLALQVKYSLSANGLSTIFEKLSWLVKPSATLNCAGNPHLQGSDSS